MVHAIAETNPLKQICDVFFVISLSFATDVQWQGYVLPSGQVIKEPKILKNNADAAAQTCPACRVDVTELLVE